MNRARQELLARLAKHGTVFERDVCSRSLGLALARDGLVTRFPGYGPRRLTTLHVTDAGKAAATGFDCACYRCKKAARRANERTVRP